MNIDKFRAHLGKPIQYKIGKDTFDFKPLTVEYLKDIFTIIKATSENPDSPFSNLSDEHITIITNLIRVMIKKSYPDIEKDFAEEYIQEGETEEVAKKLAIRTLDDFIFNNYFSLIGALFETNNLGGGNAPDEDMKKKLLEMRDKQMKNESKK